MNQLKHRKVLNIGSVKLENFMGDDKSEHGRAYGIFQFRIKAPMFVARHLNPTLAWYFDITKDFYVPSTFRDKDGAPLSEKDCNEMNTKLQNYNIWAFNFYNKLVEKGLSEDQARLVIPTTINIEFFWRVNSDDLQDIIRWGLDGSAPFEYEQFARTLLDFYADNLPLSAKRDLAHE